jgi:hypothetical protein
MELENAVQFTEVLEADRCRFPLRVGIGKDVLRA